MSLLAFHDPILDHAQNSARFMRFGAHLSAEAVSDFDSLGRLSGLPKAVVLFKEDGPSRNVIFLHSGEIKLSVTSSRGRTLIRKIARSGDLLGLGAVICGTPYEMTAETLVPASIRAIPKTDFLRFIDRHRGLPMQMARLLAEDSKSAFLDAQSFAYLSASERLASVLLNWERTGFTPELQPSFEMTLTHDELGSLTGVSRETISRVLSEFQRKKLIEIHGAYFLILDPKRLASLSS